MTPHLHIYLLGDFRLALGDEAPLFIPQARHQALLTYLLLHRHAPQSRRHLAFLLWPDSSETQALTNLRKALTHLRQIAPRLAQSIYADHQVVQWRPTVACTVDVAEFESKLDQATAAEQAGRVQDALRLWSAAVAHYTGPLTPSCYDDWLITERERLHQLCLGALERLVTGYERQQEPAAALPYAQQLLRLDPLQETTYLQLMRLQALLGDRAAALRTYHTCATVLARELGVEPAPETQAAYARLLNLETDVKATPPTRNAKGLVGRQAEWEKLQRSWRLATGQGSAHVVCVWGEAGIGKTRLAEELLHWAGQQGFTVVRTRAYAGEGQLAYAPVVEWLRVEAVRNVRSRLAPVWLSEVARLAPEILSEQPAVPAPAPMTEPWQRQRLWEALARALLAAPQPMLLVIDDLQWCDTETLEWLRYLLHFAPQARLLVVGTARPEEVAEAHPLPTLCRHLRSSGQLTELELGPLDDAQSALLATQVAPQPLDAQTQHALYRATTGNPLFLVEMVRAGVSKESAALPLHQSYTPIALPPKVQAVIQSRLAQLSPPVRAVAQVAAVIGQDFTFNLLRQASDYPEDDLVRGLDELWQRRIIREQGVTTYDFSHDRIRDVVYSEISPIRRRQLHRQIAVALEQQFVGNLDTVSSALAFHYEQAGLLKQAVRYYRQAGDVALERYAYHDATVYLQQGLTLFRALPTIQQTKEEELQLLIALGSSLSFFKAFSAPEVGEIYQQALALCQQVGNQTQRYMIQNGLRTYYDNQGNWQLSLTCSEDNLVLALALNDAVKVQRAHHGLGIVYLMHGGFSQALTYFERSDQDKLTVPTPISLAHAALCLWLLGYPAQARQQVAQIPTVNQACLHPPTASHNLFYAAIVYRLLQDTPILLQFAEMLAKIAITYHLGLDGADAAVHAGFAHAKQGETALGIAEIRQALTYYNTVQVRMFVPYVLTCLAEIFIQTGETEAALVALTEALAVTNQTEEWFYYAETLRLRGEALLMVGAPVDDVESSYQQARQLARQQQAKSLELRVAMSLARLWQQQGQVTEAYQLLAAVYGWFTEGFDTADLVEAKTLLTALSSQGAIASSTTGTAIISTGCNRPSRSA